MTAPYAGGCQCGQIRYEIRAEPLTLYACHCKECQRQSSSAFGMSMTVSREAVVILQGQPKDWTRGVESERSVQCFFCGDCGTRLFHQRDRHPNVMNIKAGTLDDTSWLNPAGHIWTRSKQPWVILDEGLHYEGQPSDYAALCERFQNQ